MAHDGGDGGLDVTQRSGLIGGRFEGAPGADMVRYSSSLAVDLRMLDEDVDGSLAHVRMLGEVGMLTPEEAERLCVGLEQVREEIRAGIFRPTDAHEDVHMAVETRLTEVVGEVGKKLHTARSRNDQVATDVRLWLVRRLSMLDGALAGLLASLLDRVEADGEILMPGYTHLQRGQPILLGHHLLAHAWAVSRDRERLRDASRRLDRSPLGACAMAGTPHPIDRLRTAELLGFAGVVENAMDAVSARDHQQEVASACAIAMTHLSRMAEELVLWSSSEFRFVRLGETYATGSSIMPQKRNPDAAELLRGKSARVLAAAQGLLILVKGLPLAYNRDLQEDRSLLFDAVETTLDSVGIAAGMWRTLAFDARRFEAELDGDFSLATELADYLAQRGVPFREAHEVVGRIVRHCEEEGHDLRGLTPDLAYSFHPLLGGELGDVLDPRQAAERRTSRGGTAGVEIRRQAELLRAELE
jgi:argininosuccinate lyase